MCGHPCCRRHLARLLVLDGRDKLEMWWVEEGYLTDLSNVLLVRRMHAPLSVNHVFSAA